MGSKGLQVRLENTQLVAAVLLVCEDFSVSTFMFPLFLLTLEQQSDWGHLVASVVALV